MNPSYYLKPDHKKVQTFLQSFSMSDRERVCLTLFNTDCIWVDEAENRWEWEYSCPVPVSEALLDTLENGIKNTFNLNGVKWKNAQTKTENTEQEPRKTKAI